MHLQFFRGYWYLMDEYFMPGDYEKSLINSQIYGVLVLFVFHCGCSLHAGIYGDVSKEKGGNMIEYYYSSYFFMKVWIWLEPSIFRDSTKMHTTVSCATRQTLDKNKLSCGTRQVCHVPHDKFHDIFFQNEKSVVCHTTTFMTYFSKIKIVSCAKRQDRHVPNDIFYYSVGR